MRPPEMGAQPRPPGQERLDGSRKKCPPSPSRRDPRSCRGPRCLGAHAAARGWPGQGADSRDRGPRPQPPPAAPGAVAFRVAAARPRGSCAQPDAALRAPAQPFPLRRRPPLAGGPSAWRHTWQLTGAVLRTRRGGGGGRAAGACRGPVAPGGWRSCRRLAGRRGEERSGRCAAEGGLGTWAPLCVATPGAGRGAGRGRLLPPPRGPPRVPTVPAARASPPARRRPAAAPRGGFAAWGSAGPSGGALPRAGRVGAGRAAASWGVGPGKRGCAGGKTEFLLFLENPTSGALPEL